MDRSVITRSSRLFVTEGGLMGLLGYTRRTARLTLVRVRGVQHRWYCCPICRFHGPFETREAGPGTRQHAICPKCGAFERHRIQFLALQKVAETRDLARMSCLHFAPETCFRLRFRTMFRKYVTADLQRADVDHQVDLIALPFEDASFDLVYASHVLEHIKDDEVALSEIRRILRPGGVAIIPVPIVGSRTVEYPQANPHEFGHVRAPGPDYFDRYERFFRRVDRFRSEDFDERYQTFIYEDRSGWPNATLPWRQPTLGLRHSDFVPVCYV